MVALDPTADRRTDVAPALNRRDRLAVILGRGRAQCIWCGRDVGTGLVAATTDHVVPRTKGGPSWLENEVAACRRCNSGRGNRNPGEWLQEGRAQGGGGSGGGP